MVGNALSEDTTVHFLLYILFKFQLLHGEHKFYGRLKSHTFLDPPPIKKWGPRALPLSEGRPETEEVALQGLQGLRLPYPASYTVCLEAAGLL